MYVLVQGVNRLFARVVVPPGGAASVNASVPHEANDQVFVTVYSNEPLLRVGGGFRVDGMPLAANVRWKDPAFDPPAGALVPTDTMSGGFHRWFTGFYNGEIGFSEASLVFPVGPDGKPISDPPSFNFAVPARDGNGSVFEPLWMGPSSNSYIGKGRQNTTRLGFDGESSTSAGPSYLRSATAWNLDIDAGLSLGIGFQGAISKGRSNTEMDFFDFNGDRIPDIVTLAGVLYGDGKGGFEPGPGRSLADPSVPRMAPAALRRVEHRAVRENVSAGVPIKLTQRTDTQGRPLDLLTLGFSVGHDYSMSIGNIDWIDVNGDGLPDLVQRDAGDKDAFNVQLNYGYGLSSPMKLPASPWITQHVGGINETLVKDGTLILDGFHSEIGVDQIRVEDTGNSNLGTGVGLGGPDGGFSAGSGKGYSVTRTIVDLIDVNGDGLPDQVMKLVGGDENRLRVRLNRGDHFDTEERSFSLPAWGTQVNTGLEGDLFTFLGPNGTDGDVDDALQYRRGKSSQFNVGFKICYWIFCIGATGYHSRTAGGQNVTFEDIDGDGYVDQVLKVGDPSGTPNHEKLLVKLNKSSQVNLLSVVHRPLGGNISLRYGREGNLVRADLAVDEPTNKFVLTQVDIDDGRGNHYAHAVDYHASGFHDRIEREDYGFGAVTVARLNGTAVDSTVETRYENQDFYRRGLVKQTSTADAAGNLFTGSVLTYADPAASNLPARTGSFFPSKTSEKTRWYEGSTTDFNQFSKESLTSYLTYDDVGNLTDFKVFGDDGTSDDVGYHVDIDPTLKAAGISRPREITAKDASNTVLRDRIATYDSHGALSTITYVVTGGKDPTTGAPYTGTTATNQKWTLTYDDFGNVLTFADPRGYTLTYDYDTAVQTYRTSTADSFGYKSFSAPNVFYGVPASTTDTSGQMVVYTFDGFGRLLTVAGPNDIGTSEATIAFTYSETESAIGTPPPAQAFPAFATTSHKDVQRPGNPIVTVTFADGMERVIQTKKDVEVDNNGSGTKVGLTVSGAILFDGVGRIQEQGQPKFDQGPATTFVNLTRDNPTKFTYDILDRTTSVTDPANNVTSTAYGFDTLDGVLRLATTVKDANVNAGGGRPGAQRETFSDLRGLVFGVAESNRLSGSTPTALITRYGYDAVNDLTKVTDAKGNLTTAVYDTVGRMVTLTSPDAGTTEWRYDLSGNLGAKQTAKLAKLNQFIQYQYDFNRLKKIVYPTTTAVTYTYGAKDETGDAKKNLAGRLKQETSEAGSHDYQYDRLGNVTQDHWVINSLLTPPVAPYDRTLTYTYDSFGRLLTEKFPDAAKEVVSYGYDQGGNVTKVTGVNSNSSMPGTTNYVNQVVYDQFEQRVRLVYGNGIQQSYTYEPLTRRLSQVNASQRDPALIRVNKPARAFEQMRYSYDPVGNINEIRNDSAFDDLNQSFVLTGTVAQNFTYDDLYQLKTATGTYQENSGWRLKYNLNHSYDGIGNILTKNLATDRQIPDSAHAGQWVKFYSIHDATYKATYTYGAPRPHAPKQVDEKVDQNTFVSPRILSYDDSGNQTGWVYQTNETRAVEWTEEDRIHRVTLNGVELAKSSYDGSGTRTVNLQVPAAGTVAFYETAYFGHGLTLRNGSFMTKHIFLGDTRIASKMDASWLGPVPTTIYFHDDQLGSTNFLTNDLQELVAHEEYFPTGELWVDEFDRRYPMRQQGYLFNGKEFDAATGLYYYGARYYDPHLSIWASPDPILASYMRGAPNDGVFMPRNLGLYTYTWNNPVVLRDPDGSAVGENFFIRTGKGLLGAGYGGLKSLVPGGFLAPQPGGTLANDSDFLGGQAAGEVTVGVAEMVGGGVAGAFGVLAEIPSLGTATVVVAGGVAAVAEGYADVKAGGQTLMMANKAAERERAAQKGPGTVADERGVKIDVYSNDHGPPHAHVKSGDRNTRVGQNGKPLRGEGALSKIEQQVVDANKKELRSRVGQTMKDYRKNNPTK